MEANPETFATSCVRVMGAGLWNLPGSVMQQMLGARGWFQKMHEETGVRMAFLCCGAWLIQWYEGTPEAVEAAWARAALHPAQRNLRLLHRSTGSAFLPEAIHIASLHDGTSPAEVGRRIFRAEREHAAGFLAEPSDIWHALGAPSRAQPSGATSSFARRGLVVLTCESNECFDVLKSLAERAPSAPVHQRFANGQRRTGDVGAAYIDLDSGSFVTRVQALSRAALGNRMVRLALRDTHCIFLLVGDRIEAAQALATEVAAWVSDEPLRPDVRVIGSNRPSCQAAADVLGTLVPRLHVAIDCAAVPGRSRVAAMADIIAGAPCVLSKPLDLEFS